MTIPAGPINNSTVIANQLKSVDDIFENFIERMAHMDVPVGVGRSVVQYKLFSIEQLGLLLIYIVTG